MNFLLLHTNLFSKVWKNIGLLLVLSLACLSTKAQIATNNQINLQSSQGKGNLSGQVLSSDGQPVGYVNIHFAGRPAQAAEMGNFKFTDIEAGSYNIKAKYVGFMPHKTEVNINENETKQRN